MVYTGKIDFILNITTWSICIIGALLVIIGCSLTTSVDNSDDNFVAYVIITVVGVTIAVIAFVLHKIRMLHVVGGDYEPIK
jgi:uncharacterized Tic20 family protein